MCTGNNSDSKVFANSNHDKSFLLLFTEHFPGPHDENGIIELACNESGLVLYIVMCELPSRLRLAWLLAEVRYMCIKISPKKNFSLPTYPNLFGPLPESHTFF